MVKNLTVSGAIAAGVAGILFTANPAQATTSERTSGQRAGGMQAIAERAVALGVAGEETAALRAVDELTASRPGRQRASAPRTSPQATGRQVASQQAASQQAAGRKGTRPSSGSTAAEGPEPTETEGHETEIAQKNSCNSTKVKVNVYVHNAKDNPFQVILPAKSDCTSKAKAASINKGNVKSKQGNNIKSKRGH
jgi:hypothetical protein